MMSKFFDSAIPIKMTLGAIEKVQQVKQRATKPETWVQSPRDTLGGRKELAH